MRINDKSEENKSLKTDKDTNIETVLRRMAMTKLSTLCYIEKDDKYLMLHRTVKNDVNKINGSVSADILNMESPEECLLSEREAGYTLTSWAYRES